MIAIVGPTAGGKTDLAIEAARSLGAQVISVDSMQVYRGMDIGTAKPTVIERRGVVHHMIDVAEAEDEFSVAEFRRQGRAIIKTSRVPLIITGGSGLHFRALVDPMSFAPTDPGLREELESTDVTVLIEELAKADSRAGEHVDLGNTRRVVRAVEIFRLTGETPSQRAHSAEAEDLRRYKPDLDFTAVGIDPGSLLDERIDRRLSQMREGGLVSEVRGLEKRMGRTAASAVGYREILDHLNGEIALDRAFEAISRNTRKLAKKQRTWFQRDPRIHWIPWLVDADERVERILEYVN